MNKLFSVIKNPNAASFDDDLSLWDVSNVKIWEQCLEVVRNLIQSFKLGCIKSWRYVYDVFYCENFDQNLKIGMYQTFQRNERHVF